MNDITDPNAVPTATMTSRELADLVEKRHDNVKRTIETLVERGVISQPQIEDGPRGANGVVERHYRVGKRDSYVIVAQLSPEFTARLVDRWQALEDQARNPIAALSRMDLLKLAMDSEQKRLQLEHTVEVLEPKAAALDLLVTVGRGSYCLRDAAKLLKVPERKFVQQLHKQNLIYPQASKGWRAYSEPLKEGLLEHKITTGAKEDGTTWESVQPRMTTLGMVKAAVLFGTQWPPIEQVGLL